MCVCVSGNGRDKVRKRVTNGTKAAGGEEKKKERKEEVWRQTGLGLGGGALQR